MARPAAIVFLESFFQWLKSIRLSAGNKSIYKFLKSDFWTRINVQYTLKTAIAVVLSYSIALIFVDAYALWAPITTIIVMQVNVASSVETSVDRILGSLYGALIAMVLEYILPAKFITENIGLFIIALLCAALLLINPRYRLAGITSISIFLLAPQNPPAWKFALTFMLIVTIGIVVAVLVSVFIWPMSGAAELRQSLKKQYLMAADFLEGITRAFMDSQNHLLPTYLDDLHNAVGRNRPEFRRIKEFEAINLARHYPDLEMLIIGLEQTRTYLSSMLDALASDAEPIKDLPMKEEFLELASSSASGLRWLAAHDNGTAIPEVRWYIEATSIRLKDLFENKDFLSLSQAQFIQLLAFYNAMNHLAETVANLEEQSYIIMNKHGKHLSKQNKSANFVRKAIKYCKVKIKHYAKKR